MATDTPSLPQLRRALALAEQIQQLEAELSEILGGAAAPRKASSAPAQPAAKKPGRPARKKRVLSPEGRARIVAALKARHAARRNARA